MEGPYLTRAPWRPMPRGGWLPRAVGDTLCRVDRQVIKLGRAAEWRRRRFAWAAGTLAVGVALNEVDRPGPWWHRLAGLTAAVFLGLGFTNLIAACTRRRIVLTDDRLRLVNPVKHQ